MNAGRPSPGHRATAGILSWLIMGYKSVNRHPRAKVACNQSSSIHTYYRWIPVLNGFRNPSRSGVKNASRMSGSPVATS